MSYSFFLPVQVQGGRKFQGTAYFLEEIQGDFGPRVCLWDPLSHTKVYASSRFCSENQNPPSQEEQEYDRQTYFRRQVDSTLSWCKGKRPGESEQEIREWAYSILAKHHPEIPLQAFFPEHTEASLKDQILSTLRWASGLKTEAGFFHGRWCDGGQSLGKDRKILLAQRALFRKGLSQALPGWEEAWQEALSEVTL